MRYMRILMLMFIFIAPSRLSLRAEDKAQFLQWNFKLSGEERLRYEYKRDFDLNEHVKDNGGQFYHRFRLGENISLVDEYLNPKVDFFIEGLDAQTGGYKIKAPRTQTDDFDLHQAYINAYKVLGSDFSVKIGRQELKYGQGRLIAAPTWANRIRSFDAGVLRYEHGGFWVDTLYGQDVKYKDDYFNNSRQEEFLTGVYGGYQKHKLAPLFEAYFLEQKDIKGKNDTRRYTIGARVEVTVATGTIVEVELPYQFGKSTTGTAPKKDIKAYAYHVGLTKNWVSALWTPKLFINYDEAMGDKSSKDSQDNNFIPLYQSTHAPYGVMDMVRWQNIRDGEIGVTLSVTDKLRLTPQVDMLWLQNKNSPWYNSSGTTFKSKTTGKRNSFLGTEWSLTGTYAFTKEFKFESGYAHFVCGPYAKAIGAHDDADWFYTQASYKF